MSSQVPRHLYSLAAATLMLTAGISRTAAAKPCTTDSDCATGYQCSLAPTNGGSAGGGGTTGSSKSDAAIRMPDYPVSLDAGVTQVPDAGVATVASSTGTCEPKPVVCASVADCPADFDCVKGWIAVTNPACPANTKCETPPPQQSETGTCQAVPRACSTSADCPAPLVCQAQGSTCSGGASVGPDGAVTTMEETCTPGKSVCTYVPTVCTTDSACPDSYQCAKVRESQRCSGSSGMCTRTADGSVSCTEPEPPVCTTVVVMNCMPKQIACGAGQACPSGWSCFDYSNLGGLPTGWTADESGKSCMPDGLILAIAGHAAGSDTSTGGGDSLGTAGGDKGGSVVLRADAGATGGINVGISGGLDAGATTAPSDPTVSANEDAGATQPGTGVIAAKAQGGGGCTLGDGRPASTTLWLALALAGLVVRVARRRPSGRQ